MPVEVDIIRDKHGTPLTEYKSEYNKTWILGQAFESYSIRLHNQSDERVLAVVSVDGVNVVSGQTAAVHQSGYILEPWRETVIEGWRKSDSEVAKFYFNYPEDSYAGKTGRPDNLGVIGVALFREKPEYRRPIVLSKELGAAAEMNQRAQGPSADSSAVPSAAPSLGTGHGQRIESRVYKDKFDRERNPFDVIEIRYGNRKTLINEGVFLPHINRLEPVAFPEYVPDP